MKWWKISNQIKLRVTIKSPQKQFNNPLRFCASLLASFLIMFSIMLKYQNNGNRPKLLRCTRKDCNLTKSNYRPLSILPALSKVFERLVHNRVSPYFEDMYHKFVFAHRKSHGCDTALLRLTENGERSWTQDNRNGLYGFVKGFWHATSWSHCV